MFQHKHPFTWISVALTLIGGILSVLSTGAVGPVFLVLAQVCALAEFKKYTSRFQFTMIIVSAVMLGLVIDLRAHVLGAATVPLVLIALALVLRQACMQVFTYVNYLWIEPSLLLVASAIMIHNWLSMPFQWEMHVLPLVPFSAACFLAGSYVQDGLMMKKKTRSGYRVLVGKPAPDFVLPDQEGNSVRLADYRGKHPVLLIFVRGDWCPGCHIMLRTYERSHEKFKARGVHVLGIGPDSVDVNKDMVQRIGVGYRLLSDNAQLVSQQYGVVYDNPAIEQMVNYSEGIPLPASFLVDVHGVVRYVSRPDRVGEFLDPTLIFGILDQLPDAGQAEWKAA